MKMSRVACADMFGPITDDRVRLADTDLIIEVEKDFTVYGEEGKFGGDKVNPATAWASARSPIVRAQPTRSLPMR